MLGESWRDGTLEAAREVGPWRARPDYVTLPATVDGVCMKGELLPLRSFCSASGGVAEGRTGPGGGASRGVAAGAGTGKNLR